MISEIPFPPGAAVSVIERNSELFAPSGDTRIEPGDQVYVFSRQEDRPRIPSCSGRRRRKTERAISWLPVERSTPSRRNGSRRHADLTASAATMYRHRRVIMH